MITVPFKRGDWFVAACTYADKVDESTTTPIDLTGWTVASQVRYKGTLVSALTVTVTDAAAGAFQLEAQSTQDWPAKELACDIQYTAPSGQVMSTETFAINCVADETQP